MSEQRGDLVEPEGVNAGSADQVGESRTTGADAQPLGGGNPAAAPTGREDEMPPEEEMAGAAGTTATDPSQHAGPPGQDTGSAR